MNHLRRIISFLLVLVLCIGLVPGVSAAEVDTPGADIPTEVTEETAPPTTEDTTPTEESAPEEPPVEEAPPEESVPDAENTEPSSEDVPQNRFHSSWCKYLILHEVSYPFSGERRFIWN